MNVLRINPEAKRDLIDIRAYIAEELKNPDAAERTVREIITSIRRLPEQPLMGPSLDAIIEIDTDYRYLLSGSYYIFYKYDGKAISVYRVIYMRRDIIRVLFS